MRIGPWTIARTKALQLAPLSNRGGWWPIVRESFTGAWQQNVEVSAGSALSYYAVYSCVRLITTDIGKLTLRLVERDAASGVWTETESPAFSPLLRTPNRYQTINKFVEQWILSKLLYGNAYVWLERDARRVVVAMYVLDPTRVTPLVTPAGDIYYELRRDDLSGLPQERLIVPARDIIHDTMIAPYHPLIGLSPIYACGLSALQGLTIQNNSHTFFSNGANPSGILTAPGEIDEATATRLLAKMNAKGAGEVLVAGSGLKFEKFTMSATDAQLIEQLRMTAEQVCSAFGVPPYLVDIGPPPPYANFEPLLLKYHSQCVQSLTINFEKTLDRGMGLEGKVNGTQYGTEFDVDDLIWMDTATRVSAAQTSINAGMAPNEARRKYHGLGPVAGGNAVYLQQQYYSLEALADRDAADPFAKPAPQAVSPPFAPGDDALEDDALEARAADLLAKELAA